MDKLEKLMQEESGKLHRADGRALSQKYVIPQGKIRTFVVANPCLDVSKFIDKMAEGDSFYIPEGANAYVASDFDGSTQHLRGSTLEGKEKLYCVFAVQFYRCLFIDYR